MFIAPHAPIPISGGAGSVATLMLSSLATLRCLDEMVLPVVWTAGESQPRFRQNFVGVTDDPEVTSIEATLTPNLWWVSTRFRSPLPARVVRDGLGSARVEIRITTMHPLGAHPPRVPTTWVVRREPLEFYFDLDEQASEGARGIVRVTLRSRATPDPARAVAGAIDAFLRGKGPLHPLPPVLADLKSQDPIGTVILLREGPHVDPHRVAVACETLEDETPLFDTGPGGRHRWYEPRGARVVLYETVSGSLSEVHMFSRRSSA